MMPNNLKAVCAALSGLILGTALSSVAVFAESGGGTPVKPPVDDSSPRRSPGSAFPTPTNESINTDDNNNDGIIVEGTAGADTYGTRTYDGDGRPRSGVIIPGEAGTGSSGRGRNR
jgi:hypothetical protein